MGSVGELKEAVGGQSLSLSLSLSCSSVIILLSPENRTSWFSTNYLANLITPNDITSLLGKIFRLSVQFKKYLSEKEGVFRVPVTT